MRRSSGPPRCVGAVFGVTSSRRARSHHAITPALRTMKTASPAQPLMTPASAISPKKTAAPSRKWKASASLLSGFFTLEDVDRRVDHDPHYVDEVPVDPGNLDPVVGFRRVVTAVGADRGREQQRQPDEDVRPVQPGQAEEDRPEGVRVRREADA